MHKVFSVAAVAAFTMLLAACGGDAFKSSTTPTGQAGTLSAIAVSNSGGLPADGSTTSTITATATDGSGAAMSGVAITFTNSSGTLSTTTGATDSSGKATTTLSLGAAAPGSSITVTATSGTISGSTAVAVGAISQSVTLQTSSPQITSDNSTPAVITAFVKDAKNNFVPGAVVHFQASSGGLAINAPTGGMAGQTDASGAATATLSTAGDPTNRDITVTATVGGSTTNIIVHVVGSTLTVSGPSSLVMGTAGTYSVSLFDAAKKAIGAQAVTLTSAAGNSLSAATVTTDPSGHATFTLTAAKSGADTVSASALGITASQNVAVSNQQFQFTAPSATTLIPITVTASPTTPCTPNTATNPNAVAVVVNWTSSTVPVADGTVVNFASTRGTLSAGSAVTTGGNATVVICSTNAGQATLSATGTGVSATQTINFVSTTPSVIDLQPSPTTVAITGQSTLTAIVRDAIGNLVQGQTVDFSLTDITGGKLSLASATTDIGGVAQSVYTASTTPSAPNGVSVTATVHGTAISKAATLTVDGAALSITIGTGNKVRENDTKTAFIMDWFLSVKDASGHPVPSTAVSLTVHSASRPFFAYWKGSYEVCGTSWQQYDGVSAAACAVGPPIVPATLPTACLNEDVNLNGILDPGEDITTPPLGVLLPGDVALTSPGVVTTAVDGTGTFTVVYPEDHALWVQVTLTAKATVSGTESSTSTTFVLPMLAIYLTTTSSSPPGFVSPYGVHACNIPH
ncbi:MAG TPA: Ig-like domain-containing protein [Steroidobacteraceae bacterium]|nr:Ig-like domain-containing protein [Steroidobacteraceae bacterium]